MLHIDNLTHRYGKGEKSHLAIDGLSLTVAENELVSIVGPSGSGKSTLIRCIAGLIRPTSGQITLAGTPVEHTPDNLAVVFQDYSRSLFPWMTVADNVALPLRRKGRDRRDRIAVANEALEQVGLGGAGRKYPWELSGGMQQRVSIARALAYRPALMLMDEPFGSVDAQTREDLEDLLLSVREHHKMTIILITHDIDESVYVGDRVIVLSPAPAKVRGDLPIVLPTPRDQIATREHPDFVHLRAEIGRLVRRTSDDQADDQAEANQPASTQAQSDQSPCQQGVTMSEAASVPSNDSQRADPRDAVWNVMRGLWRFTALHAMAELRCADHLADGPLSADELAKRCGADAAALERVLRVVAAIGLVKQVTPGTYALTESGETLRSDSPNSLRAGILVNAEAGSWDAMGSLPEAVRTGRSTFVEKYGPLYDYLAAHPEAGLVFNEFMRLRSQPMAQGVANGYDFSGINTIMDVGGGKGTFLAAILDAHPHLRGVLFERDAVMPEARENVTDRGLTDRCDFVTGDFFESVPEGADAYLLASIIHNWDDDDALRILRSVRAALPEHGRVLLVDAVLPDDDRPHLGKDLDVRMLTLFGGGRERTESDYFGLLTEVGLRARIAAELPIGLSLVEAVPAD